MSKPRWSGVFAAGLALTLVGGVLPTAGLAAAAAAPADILAAAYLGAGDAAMTSLPDQVDGEAVTWTIDENTFDEAYSTVEVLGTTASDARVHAAVEIVPPADHPLVYFVDSGHGGDSEGAEWSAWETDSRAFTGVQSLAGDTLRNDKPDQDGTAEGAEWGFLYGPFNAKLTVHGGDPTGLSQADLAMLDKYEIGLRTNQDRVAYRLDLEPGTYTLSSGVREFYPGGSGWTRSRDFTPVVSFTVDGEEDSETLEQISMRSTNGATPNILSTDSFTLPDGAEDVTLTYLSTGGEAPSLSWFAIAAGDAVEAITGVEPEQPVEAIEVTVDAEDIRADNVNGLTFKGFGVLSANSTSAVLMDYKSEHPDKYEELLEILFGGERPIMNHVKMEMGNDRNNSTGPDPATKRTADEPVNIARAPGFQLAADARKYNPDLEVSILRWNAPAWVDGNDDVYTWYKETILAAYREYGYMVGYVNPGINEHPADSAWLIDFAQRVRTDDEGFADETERALFNQIQVVSDDAVSMTDIGARMVGNEALRDAVGVAAYHYNPNDDAQDSFKRLAVEFDKQVWNSEAQATFSDSTFRPNNNVADPTVPGTGIGGTNSGLEMANTAVKGFVNSHRSHFIYQPAIGSFFEGGQYSFKELISARDPWSGWMHYDAGLAIVQHFSSFATTGWENADNDAGIWRLVPEASESSAAGINPVVGRAGGPNYVTLAAPDRTDFSTVIVNDSEYRQHYRITPENFPFDAQQALGVWETRAAGVGEAPDANYKQKVASATPQMDGSYVVEVEPYSIVTVTSLADSELDEGWHTPLPTDGERTVLDLDPAGGVLWEDDFDYSERTVPVFADGGGLSGRTEPFVASRGGEGGAIPLFTWDRNGAFEAVTKDDGSAVLRQQIDREATGVGGAWNGGDPITAVGDRRWVNYRATVDARFERETADNNYVAVGVRSSGGDNSQSINSTPYTLRLQPSGTWNFHRFGGSVLSGTLADFDASAWHELSLQAAGDTVTGWVDGEELFTWTDPTPIRSGWVDLATGYRFTEFDNLKVERIEGYSPYYGEYLDNMEHHTVNSTAEVALDYAGSWRHANGQSMYHYQRSVSQSLGAGASLSYDFTGTGLDIIGANDGSAVLGVTLDGEPVAQRLTTNDVGQFEQTFALRGLPDEQHRVTLTVLAGSLHVDAVGVVTVTPEAPADTAHLEAALTEALTVERTADFTDVGWAALQNNIAHAQEAVTDPVGYGLDEEGAAQLAERLAAASSPVLDRIIDIEQVHTATVIGTAAAPLPETLTVTLDDQSTRELPVAWDDDGVSFDEAWSTVRVTGSLASLPVTAAVEVVPAGVVAFVDVNGTEQALGFESPAYRAISDLDEVQLINEVPDQLYGDEATWGSWGRNAAGTESFSHKGVESGPYDKLTTTGMYTANQAGASVGVTIDDLPAGSYTVAAGSHSWWAGYARTAEAVLTYDGESHVVDTGVVLDNATPNRVLSYDVTLEEDGPVEFALRTTMNQSPMLSWVAVVEQADEQTVLTGLEVEGPDKVTYQVGEELDRTGFTATAVYSDGTTADVTERVTLTGYDPQSPGEQAVTVAYEEDGVTHTTTFAVTVVAPGGVVLTGLQITPPDKVVYQVDEDLDLAGFSATAVYSDGTTADVTEQVTLTGYDSQVPGEQLVTVTYEDGGTAQAAAFTVTVTEAPGPGVTEPGDDAEQPSGPGVTEPGDDAEEPAGPPAEQDGDLPSTGVDIAGWLIAALLLIATGGLVLTGRRLRQE